MLRFTSGWAIVGLALALAPGPSVSAQARPGLEWHDLTWSGGRLSVALVRPSAEATGPRPVVLALPWGSGSAQLVRSFVSSYWQVEPALRGYYVVAPVVTGSSLAGTATDVIPAIFEWMDDELTYDPGQVALVGASNGGRGAFFAALAAPERFAALMVLPGQYRGEPSALASLAGKPIRLIVGEYDDPWVEGTRSTYAALRDQGVEADFLVAGGQEHVMRLDPRDLMDWIDASLGR